MGLSGAHHLLQLHHGCGRPGPGPIKKPPQLTPKKNTWTHFFLKKRHPFGSYRTPSLGSLPLLGFSPFQKESAKEKQ